MLAALGGALTAIVYAILAVNGIGLLFGAVKGLFESNDIGVAVGLLVTFFVAFPVVSFGVLLVGLVMFTIRSFTAK